MPKNDDLHDYILYNYKKKIFLKQYNVYRKLGNNIERDIWKWATTIGYGEPPIKLNVNDPEVIHLTEDFNNKYKQIRKKQESNKKKMKKIVVKRKDTRSIRNAKGQFGRWVPPPKREQNRDKKGRFISKEEYNKLVQLTINKQRTQTPERIRRNNDIENFLTQRTNRREQEKKNNKLFEKLEEARDDKNKIRRRINDLKNKLEGFKRQRDSGSGNRIENNITIIETKIKQLENKQKEAEEKEKQLSREVLAKNREPDLPTINNSDDDENNFDDSDNFDDIEDNVDNKETTTTTQVTQDTSIINTELPMYKTWTPTTEIKYILRRPIRLKTILKWIQMHFTFGQEEGLCL